VPADKASIGAVAALHAVVTLALLDDPAGYEPGFNSLLMTLRRVAGVFEEPFRPYRFRVARNPACLVCQADANRTGEDLDVALDQALARLAHE
jgi:hypothetical protein